MGTEAILSFAVFDSYKARVLHGMESKREYADYHGYQFYDDVEDVFDHSRPAAWSKIRLLLKHFHDGHDWLFWSDADTVFTNFHWKLSQLRVDVRPEHDLVVIVDPRGSINTGNFFVRPTAWAEDLLGTIYGLERYICHPWWENAAFIHALWLNDPTVMRKVKIVLDSRRFNAYPEEKAGMTYVPPEGIWKQGDFLVHFAGVRDFPPEMMERYRSMSIGRTRSKPSLVRVGR